MILGLSWLVALLVRLFLCRLPIRLVVGRLLWRLVVWWLLLRLLPRITHVPDRIPGRSRIALHYCPDDKNNQGDEKQDAYYGEHRLKQKQGQPETKRYYERKQYWENVREKPNPSAVWSISISHFVLVPL